MAAFQAVDAVQAVNLGDNPSFENSTLTDWTATNAAVTLSLNSTATHVLFGLRSMRVQCTATNTHGFYTDLSAVLATAPFYFTFHAKGTIPTLEVGLSATSTTTPAVRVSVTAIETLGSWTRYLATFSAVQANGRQRVYVSLPTSGSHTGDFYVDGVLPEQTTAGYTTYFDGDSGHGCEWGGARWDSPSTRYEWYGSQPVSGGLVQDLDGTFTTGGYTGTVSITGFSGLGAPGVKNVAQEKAVQPGALYQNTNFPPRTVQLNIRVIATEAEGLYAIRQLILSKIKIGQPFELRFNRASVQLSLMVVYDSGLTLSRTAGQGFKEEFTLTFVAYEPMWRLTYQSHVELSLASTASSSFFMYRSQGVWAAEYPDIHVYAMALAPDKTVYLGGRYGTTGQARRRTANGTNTALGTATGGNAAIHAVAVSLDGANVYFGGSFTDLGGTAANYISRYNVAAGTWHAMSTGLNAECYALKIGPDGSLWIGGAFSTAGGTTVNGFAKWDGSTFSALKSGVSGGGADVWALDVLPSGDVLLAGDFTAASQCTAIAGLGVSGTTGGTLSPSTQYAWNVTAVTGKTESNKTTSVSLTLGGAQTAASVTWTAQTNATKYRIYRSAAGTTSPVFFVGESTTNSFTDTGYSLTNYQGPDVIATANQTGGRTTNVCRYSPTDNAYYSVGTVGVTGGVAYAIAGLRDGASAVIGGAFTTCDGQLCNRIARWNGSTIQPMGSGASGGDVRAVMQDADGSILVGGGFTSMGGRTTATYLARWVGGEEAGDWTHTDLALPSSTVVYSLLLRYRDVLLGLDQNATATFAYNNAVTYAGTTEGRPQVVIAGPTSGTMVVKSIYIHNVGQLYLNLTVNPNERVVIDLSNGTVMSDVRGNRFRDVLSGSTLSRLFLRPGVTNTVTVLATGTTTGAIMNLVDRTAYLSIDQ